MPSLFSTFGLLNILNGLFPHEAQEHPVPEAIRKVPVTLGVMSKCPDARDCESMFDSVLEQVGDITELELTFIGSVNSDEEYGVTCKHGPSECLLNIQELCIMDLYPQDQWWPFILCVNDLYSSTDDLSLVNGYASVNEPTEGDKGDCAGANGIYWKDVKKCVKTRGAGLLAESVLRTKDLGVQKSCTVLINGKKRCVRDDAKWKECEGGYKVEDFARSIREEHEKIIH